ncbi:MAG: hypothetical protein AABY22_06605 [Nanoarchaeota archaeon]
MKTNKKCVIKPTEVEVEGGKYYKAVKTGNVFNVVSVVREQNLCLCVNHKDEISTVPFDGLNNHLIKGKIVLSNNKK